MRKEKACMAVQAFLLKGKEFRLTTDNEKEKGNWLLLKNHLFFTLSIIKFFYELCMKSFPTNYERFVTPSPQTTPRNYEQIMTSVRKTESVMDRIGCTFRFFLGNKDRNTDLRC